MIEQDMIMNLLKKKRGQRVTGLIVNLTFDGDGNGKLDTDHWIYPLSYGFRDALDIKFTERVENKKKLMVWTQGGFLSFKEGDYISSKNKTTQVQVKFAQRIGWDSEQGVMFLGSVVFDFYMLNKKVNRFECNQVDFLGFLISGQTCDLKQTIF